MFPMVSRSEKRAMMKAACSARRFVLGALLFTLFSAFELRAAEVTNNSDEGAGSLRQAVADAVFGETITFSQAPTMTLTFPTMIDKDIVIVDQINN